MINKPHVDWFALAPVLALIGVSGVLLLVAVLLPRNARKPVAAFLAFAGFVGSFVLAALLYDRSAQATTAVHDAIFRDRWAALAQVLLAGSGAVAVLISYREKMREEHIAEYYALLTAAGAGMAFFVQASNLMTLFLGLEWFSIALYVLTAIDIDLIGSLEAGLKYLIVFKSMNLDTITLDDALKLLTLPRVVGVDPETGDEITAQNGRYGPYLKKGTDSRSIDSEEKLLTITLEEAQAIYAQPKQRGRAAADPGKEVGTDPVSGQVVRLKSGRFGTYVTDGEFNATLRQGDDESTITIERAAELLAERRAKGPAKKAAKKGAKKAPAKKSAAKKTAKKTTKKAAAKKS